VPGLDPAVLELFDGLDRFVQWDLVTVTPWGAPAISPVGARLVPDEATVWTSTTVGYATKVRNIQLHPRVALLRVQADEPSILVRGEARVVAGDGTLNLAQLFRLMGGAGGARRFFATSAKDPFWRRLYRSYWHRFLIAIRIVEISRMGPLGWEPLKVGHWSPTRHGQQAPPKRRRRPPSLGLLDSRGRALLQAGVPAALASVEVVGDCPMIWPVRATVERGGGIRVDSDVSLPPGRLPHSSLAVRVVDDTFETAQMVGWMGTLDSGRGGRRLETRGPYGFIKPPGVVGDLAAGIAALVQDRPRGDVPQVSPPDLALALDLGGAESAPRLELSEPAWSLVEQVFARRNAAAPWYAGMALVVPDRQLKKSLTLFADRAQLERDWAHGVLTRGSRRVGPSRLAAGAIAFRPNPAAARATAVREEAEVGRLLESVAAQLPAGVGAPPARVDEAPRSRSGRRPDGALGAATLAAAASVAAALDRWQERSG
jgi:hypothetical protein